MTSNGYNGVWEIILAEILANTLFKASTLLSSLNSIFYYSSMIYSQLVSFDLANKNAATNADIMQAFFKN
jgi:hypothetical protein